MNKIKTMAEELNQKIDESIYFSQPLMLSDVQALIDEIIK